EHIEILLKTVSRLIRIEPGFSNENPESYKHPFAIITDSIANEAKRGTIASTIDSFLKAMIVVRERWNQVTWRTIDVIENIAQKLKQIQPKQNPNDIQNTLNTLQYSLFTFYGIVSESLPRNNGFLLFETGKLIERILSKIVIMRSIFSARTERFIEHELIEATLMNHFALVNYRSAYKSNYEMEYMLDMVLLDKQVPSSLAYLLQALEQTIAQLPHASERLNDAQKAVLRASTQIQLIDVAELSTVSGDAMPYEKLDQLLAEVYGLILSVSDFTANLYFNHTATQHSITETIMDLENEL
uniref:alpha-E domain-containing protein n=1 Tax=Siphonobacter sp. TaxID=1869184 RepID=UPI003B3AA292